MPPSRFCMPRGRGNFDPAGVRSGCSLDPADFRDPGDFKMATPSRHRGVTSEFTPSSTARVFDPAQASSCPSCLFPGVWRVSYTRAPARPTGKCPARCHQSSFYIPAVFEGTFASFSSVFAGRFPLHEIASVACTTMRMSALLACPYHHSKSGHARA